MEHLNAAHDGGRSPAARIRIVVVKGDRLAAEAIRQVAARCFPHAENIVCHTGGDALSWLRRRPVELALVGLTLPDIDGFELVKTILGERCARRLVVVSSRRDERTREFIRETRVDGYFNTCGGGAAGLARAIRAVIAGDGCSVMPASALTAERLPPVHERLTAAELRVFSRIGGGSDEQQTAEQLGVSKHTVHTQLKCLMRKLRLQTRCDVIREAACRGYVRFEPEGVVYPGSEFELSAQRTNATTRQRTTDNGQRTTDNGQRTTDNGQRTT